VLSDSHCHLDRLDLAPFGGSVDGVLENARAHGVERMLCVGIDLEALPGMLAITDRYDNVYTSVGVHPNATECEEPSIERLLQEAARPGMVAIGETGLDYFRSSGDLSWQRDRFVRHLRAAKSAGLPAIVHSRDAHEDTLAVLRTEQDGSLRGVMHCFVYDWEAAQGYLDLGFYLSFSGIVTFNSAKELREVATKAPADRILVETDAPYLTPIPYRGKSNQPAYVSYVANCVAELRSVSVEELAPQLEQNFSELFLGGN
jgi:TatD DNase family protein